MKKDITVIGGGPGGYVAAVRAAQKGADVALVEKHKVGGTCLNYGCIPTKALYKNSLAVKDIKRSKSLGIQIEDYKINFSQMMSRKDKIVNRLTNGVKYLLEKEGVELIRGTGKITASNKVEVKTQNNKKEIKTDNIIIATGSAPVMPPIKGIEDEGVLTSKELLGIDKIPEELAVIGGGVIGVEFASIFSSLGSKVYLIEKMPRLLPLMDQELAKNIKEALISQGVEVKTEAEVTELNKTGEKLTVNMKEKEGIEAEKVLVSVGRKPVLPEIDDRVNVNIDDKGSIVVNEFLETSQSNIYAIGDVIGNYQLAHVASEEGIAAVNNILGEAEKMDYKVVPSVVFSSPEIASVGLTEEEARQKFDIKVGKFPYNANGKALSLAEEEGFVKVIADKKWNEILGVHIFGYDASALIAEGSLALRLECTAEELAKTIHAHPTLPEMIKEACEDVDDISIHKP